MPFVTLLPKHALWYSAIDKELCLPISFIFPFSFVLVFSLEMRRAHLETHLSGTKAAQAACPHSSAPGFSMNALQYRYTALSLRKGGVIRWDRGDSVGSR